MAVWSKQQIQALVWDFGARVVGGDNSEWIQIPEVVLKPSAVFLGNIMHLGWVKGLTSHQHWKGVHWDELGLLGWEEVKMRPER